MKADTFVDLFVRERASAILRTDLEAAASPAMEAAVRGGFRIAEFAAKDGIVVGAGTVLTVEQARARRLLAAVRGPS